MIHHIGQIHESKGIDLTKNKLNQGLQLDSILTVVCIFPVSPVIAKVLG
jgi:hypothetical protein